MPRKKKEESPAASLVATAEGLSKAKPRREQVSVGVRAVRLSGATGGPRKRTMRGYSAAEASALFGVRAGKGGGAAFERWLADAGHDPSEMRTEADWQPLIEQFAARPIHGHRRGPSGGNHRARRR